MNCGDAVAGATGTTLDALFRRSVRVFADRVAVTSDRPGEGPWTYRELGERAERLAAGLAASGLRRGDRVAVLAETRPEWVELYVAPARLGVAAVTLNVRLHPDELVHCIAKAGPSALVTSGPCAGSAAAVRDRCPTVRDWYCLDPHETFAPYPDLLETGAPVPEPAPGPGDLHNVLYTSGTTGLPKGAMITQQAAAVRALRLAPRTPHPAGSAGCRPRGSGSPRTAGSSLRGSLELEAVTQSAAVRSAPAVEGFEAFRQSRRDGSGGGP